MRLGNVMGSEIDSQAHGVTTSSPGVHPTKLRQSFQCLRGCELCLIFRQIIASAERRTSRFTSLTHSRITKNARLQGDKLPMCTLYSRCPRYNSLMNACSNPIPPLLAAPRCDALAPTCLSETSSGRRSPSIEAVRTSYAICVEGLHRGSPLLCSAFASRQQVSRSRPTPMRDARPSPGECERCCSTGFPSTP
jgi:hypothetical protein